MIKYLEPREFYCAVITVFIGPFSLCLRGHLCLLSAQPRLKWFQLLLQKGCLWGLKMSEICGGAGREGQQHGWRECAHCQLQKPMEVDGDLTWRDWEHIRLQKQLRSLENMLKSQEGKRETLLLEASQFDFPGLFLYWEKQIPRVGQIPWVGSFGGN